MPDKIWLHKDTKYSTADTVCGYQYKFLAENEGIENFVEYICKDAFIEKACEWIKEKWDDNYTMPIIIDSVIKDFKDYIKGE